MFTRSLLAPARALMSRLPYAWKFALIGLVLLIPGGLALRAYWTQQGAQIAFSAKERVGMVYLEPAQKLVVALADARSAAVAGKPVAVARRRRSPPSSAPRPRPAPSSRRPSSGAS